MDEVVIVQYSPNWKLLYQQKAELIGEVLDEGLPPNSPRTHHIHMVEPDSILWERLLWERLSSPTSR